MMEDGALGKPWQARQDRAHRLFLAEQDETDVGMALQSDLRSRRITSGPWSPPMAIQGESDGGFRIQDWLAFQQSGVGPAFENGRDRAPLQGAARLGAAKIHLGVFS